jgi:hypothetical protein
MYLRVSWGLFWISSLEAIDVEKMGARFILVSLSSSQEKNGTRSRFFQRDISRQARNNALRRCAIACCQSNACQRVALILSVLRDALTASVRACPRAPSIRPCLDVLESFQIRFVEVERRFT